MWFRFLSLPVEWATNSFMFDTFQMFCRNNKNNWAKIVTFVWNSRDFPIHSGFHLNKCSRAKRNALIVSRVRQKLNVHVSMSAFWHCVNMKPRWWLSPYMTKYIAYREEDREIPEESWKKNCIWSSWFWVLYGHKFPLETSCWCFRRLSSGTLETINFLLYEPSYTIGVGNRELLRHHKFQHLLKIFLKLPTLSLKHFPNLSEQF